MFAFQSLHYKVDSPYELGFTDEVLFVAGVEWGWPTPGNVWRVSSESGPECHIQATSLSSGSHATRTSRIHPGNCCIALLAFDIT